MTESTSERVVLNRKTALLLPILAIIAPFSMDFYLSGLPRLTKYFHASTSAGQATLTACLLGLAFGQILSGPISDQYGRKRPLLWALSFYAIAAIACALSPSIASFTFFRIIQGLAGGAALVTANAMGRDLYTDDKLIHFYANFSTYSGSAAVIAPVVGSQVNKIVSWRGQFLILAIIGLLVGAAVTLGLPETLPVANRHSGGLSSLLHGLRRPLSDAKFRGLAVMTGLQGSGIFIYLAGSTFAFQQIYGLSATAFALVFATNSLGLTLSARISGRISKKHEPATALRIALIVTLSGTIFATLAAWRHYQVWAFAIPLFFILSGIGMSGPATNAIAMRSQKENAGAASAIMGLLRFSVGGLVAPIVGALSSNIALNTGILEFIAAFLAAAIFFSMKKSS